MKFIKVTALAAGIVLSLSACENDTKHLQEDLATADIMISKEYAPIETDREEDINKGFKSDQKNPEKEKQFYPPGSVPIQDLDKKIIKNANLNLEIKNFR